MPDKVRKDMESKFGADFSHVRLHTGAESVQLARDLNAQAFTHGQHIHFGAGRFNPDTRSGQHLLAHELTHVIQQNPKSVQRKSDQPSHPSISRTGPIHIQRQGEDIEKKEQELSAKYGMPFGIEGRHFDLEILEDLEETLGSLPEGHVTGSSIASSHHGGGFIPDKGTFALASAFVTDKGFSRDH